VVSPFRTLFLWGNMLVGACAAPAEPSFVAAPAVARARPAPTSPPGTDDLHATPCSAHLDLSGNLPELRAFGQREAPAVTTLRAEMDAARGEITWSTARPLAVSFLDRTGPVARIAAGQPGAALIEARVGSDVASILVSVPQFVRVRADARFASMLDTVLGLGDEERDVLAEARRALDAIYDSVNLRIVFDVEFHQSLPAELVSRGFAEGSFIDAVLHGDVLQCVTPRSTIVYTDFGGYAEGRGDRRLLNAPVHVCPGVFAKHDDSMAWMVAHREKLLADPRGKLLYVTIIGRAVGELLAHEIGHQLLGCETREAGWSARCHDLTPGTLMNNAGERSFTARTGIVLKPAPYGIVRADFPAPGSYEDRGVAALNRLSPYAQSVLDRLLPVPPALARYAPCGKLPE
jgi:hypothetical protein